MRRVTNRTRILLIILSLLAAIAAPALIEGYAALSRAQAASMRKDFAGAGASYEAAAHLLAWRPALWEKAALAYASGGDWQQAMPLFERAQQRGALSADGWDVFGTGYWLQSRNTEALQIWSAGFHQYPSEPKFQARLALAYRGLGRYDSERQALEAWIQTGRASAAEHYRLGQLLMTTDPDRSRVMLEQASAMDATFVPAVDTLRASLDLSAHAADEAQRLVWVGRGLGLVEEWPLAQRAFDAAARADPEDAEAWAWLGEARQHGGLDGRGELGKALALDPNDPVVLSLSGLSWKRQGQFARALLDYQRAASLDPKNAEWQAALGEAYGLTGDLVSALQAYQKATELARDQAGYWRLLAMFCADNAIQLQEVGLPAAKKAASLAPNDPAVLDALGWTYAQAGLLYNAEENLSRAAKLNPEMALVHLHLGETYLRKGDPASALVELQTASRLDSDGPVGALAGKLLQQYFR